MKINKIQLNNFRFFTDDKANNTFDFDAQNVLIYGENGSGKSSIFKAFEFLAQTHINKDVLLKSKNIFTHQPVSLEFDLNNGENIIIDEKHLENSSNYIEALAIYKPMLEYKDLLRIHYQTDKSRDEINIYEMLRELFKAYPINKNEVLSDTKNPDTYFNLLENLLNDIILNDINDYLYKFDKNFHIQKFFFDKEFTEDGKVEFIINVKIDFMNTNLDNYHHFLNEAKLSALAIAIHFAIIRNISDKLEHNSLKLLILDDLLISLDMSNRLNLIKLLQDYFNDFQIFFFTHDKALFEIFKEKMSWKSYEVYVDDKDDFEKPIIKKSLNYFQSAKKHFEEYDYPACANYLRKEIERIKKIKEKQESSTNEDKKVFGKIKKMLLGEDLMNDAKNGRIIGKLRGFKTAFEDESDTGIEIDLKNIKSITDRILNPQSHDDTSKPLYKKELEEAMEIIQNIRDEL